MILVPVRDENALHLVLVLQKIGNVGDHKINPQHIILRKGETAVNDDDRVLVLKSRDVHSNLL